MINFNRRFLSLICKYSDLVTIWATDTFAYQTYKGSCATYHQGLENGPCDPTQDLRLTQTGNCDRSHLVSAKELDPCTDLLDNDGDFIYDEIDSVCLIDTDFDDVTYNEDNCQKSPILVRRILTVTVRKMFMMMILFMVKFQGMFRKVLSYLLPSRFVQVHTHFLN